MTRRCCSMYLSLSFAVTLSLPFPLLLFLCFQNLPVKTCIMSQALQILASTVALCQLSLQVLVDSEQHCCRQETVYRAATVWIIHIKAVLIPVLFVRCFQHFHDVIELVVVTCKLCKPYCAFSIINGSGASDMCTRCMRSIAAW